MVPGTPGVNATNRGQQSQQLVGGTGAFELRDGCVFADDDLVAVFDSNSTTWDGTSITYWGFRFTLGEEVSAGGGGGFGLRELLKRYPDAYIPSGCPDDAQAFILNTIGPR